MLFYFLEARVPLTKKFTAATKSSYPNAYEFQSHSVNVKSLKDLTQHLKNHASLGHCLLKGMLDKDLAWESRANHTSPHQHTTWICLDIDNIKSIQSVDDLLIKMGISHISHIIQYSASYGIMGSTAVKAHVFMGLASSVSPSALKIWLKQINLTLFQNDLELTKTNVSLRWPLDITTCQNDKLLYISPPECDPPSLNTFTGERIQFVQRQRDALDFEQIAVPSAETVKALEESEINRLRKAAGLADRKTSSFKLKEYKGEQYLPNPDQATLSGVKEDRGFVYINLNGGDSWAYYHPAENPTFIYNFKGEPTYKTSELLPDYWASINAQKRQATQAEHKDKFFLAFRDFKTAEYYNGWYDENTEELTLHKARSEKQIQDFLVNHGQVVPDAIPLWTIEYDPTSTLVIDTVERTVNLFKASSYMKFAVVQGKVAKPKATPVIDKIIHSAVGPACYDQFLNWAAYLFQNRIAPGTAWVLHGTQGTGKGILVNKVLSPLFGPSNVCVRRMEELEDKFNDYMENSLIVFIDEAQVSESGRANVIMSTLKNYITEPVISIRRMRQSSYEVRNHVGMIFGSNMPDPVTLPPNDRRFNVGEYQPNKLDINDAEVKAIEAELQDFAFKLQQHKIDMDAVRTPMVNAAKEDMIAVSRTSADTIADALLKGDMSVLWDSLPTVDESMLTIPVAMKLAPYKRLLYELVASQRTNLSREEVQIIFDYNVGKVPESPHKFTAYIKHKGLTVKPVRVGDKLVKGIATKWSNSKQWFAECEEEIHKEMGSKVKHLKPVKSVPATDTTNEPKSGAA